MEQNAVDAKEKAREQAKNGNKNRALFYLKQKQHAEKEIAKTNGALLSLEEVLQNIESLQADQEVFAALKEGDKVIKDLQIKNTEWETLMEDHEENLAKHQEMNELFESPEQEEDLMRELQEMEALEEAAKLADVPIAGP